MPSGCSNSRKRALSSGAPSVEATRPGGWVVVEDVFFGGPCNGVSAALAAPAELAEAYPGMCDAIAKVFAAIGADANFAPRLPALLVELGLDKVGGQIFAPVLRGGGATDWVRLTLEHLRGPLVANALASEAEIEHAFSLFETGVCYLPPVMVSAWGRRTAE